MTTPRLGAPELVVAQDVPETTVNEQIRFVEQGANRFIVKDKDIDDPPGSPSDGDAYIVATASPTGAWTGWGNRIAFYMSGWKSIVPIEGTRAYVQDENEEYEYSGSAWGTPTTVYSDEDARDAVGAALQSSSGGGISVTVDDGGDDIFVNLNCPVTTQSGTSYTAVLADGNSRIRFSNGSAITFTIPANASVAYPVGTFIEIEQTGAGAVTPTPDSGVTLRARSGLTETAGQYAVAGIRKVATNEWSLTGDLT